MSHHPFGYHPVEGNAEWLYRKRNRLPKPPITVPSTMFPELGTAKKKTHKPKKKPKKKLGREAKLPPVHHTKGSGGPGVGPTPIFGSMAWCDG